MFWFDKKNPLVVFGDIRKENHVLCDGRKLEISPDIQMDFRNIPFTDDQFHLVVFDPPHLKGAGKKGWQAKKYGSLGENWREDLKLGFDECLRVLRPNGTLIFKWNEHSIKVSEVIKAIGREPLFGHRTGQSSKTMWMAFMKQPKLNPRSAG
jgi:SAM-dependent methyltransferase